MPRVSIDRLTRPSLRRGKGRAATGAGRPSTAPPVRVIPAGLSGDDLPRVDLAALRVGSVWRRGCQRVRVRNVTSRYVTVTELSHGVSLHRRIPTAAFLRTARPESKP